MSTTDQPAPSDGVIVEIPPEHVVSAPLRRQLQQCYEHGKKQGAQEKRNHEYANTLFTECVVKDPSNLVYVEAFLENLQDKYKNNKRGGRTLGFGGGKKNEFKKAVAGKKWAAVLRLGPELLKTNPWDVAVLRGMAQACEVYRYNEVELRYLKNALDANPKDIDVNRHCAVSLGRMGQFDQAIACWHRIEELKPNDPEAGKMVADLSIEKARMRAMGISPPTSVRRVAGGGSAAPSLPSATEPAPGSSPGVASEGGAEEATAKKREIQLSPLQRLERAIQSDPTMIDNYLELTDLYLGDFKFHEAERVLKRALSVSPAEPDLIAKSEELTLLRAKTQVKIAEKRALSENTAAAAELVEQLKETYHRVELEIATARSQRFPQDLELKFKLAQCLKRVGNYREAAEQFQASRDEPNRHVAATLELGECLHHLKQYVKALHCYQKAADRAAERGDEELEKAALYRGGVLAGGLKEVTTAEDLLKRVLERDPNYKDARARLDKLRQMSDKS
jgi:tetratricopeptide (TPR) repeat protein